MKRFSMALLGCLMLGQPVLAENMTRADSVWVMVTHNVADFAAWRAVFDRGFEARQNAGEISFEINTTPSHPNAVIAIFRWDTAARARAFINDPFVRNAMKYAGVTSEPIVTVHVRGGGR